MSLLDPGCEGGTIQPRPSTLRRWVFYLRNLREFVWEPIHRRLFLARQLRTERDYWQRKCEEAPYIETEEAARFYREGKR